MAFPPMYAQQAKGTLVPGQMIAVNKYNVQVEKYLSQGGFAHVYLVRTAEAVFGTTHHVLKRIAVANESMLNDVKKEVDIMRILKGHPNIVYLIDAAWHKMQSGMFEVFILMEFCSGGGIIDMMNRRLRERLTEGEILQIFVDVCEGVAAMHNLRPPLLHRDLKVENILQASASTFKLCDFGSASPVAQRPPSSMQELRALEADLNKHTTLQYRAPEMVDVFLRRPIDEKSDVWALGVLLYKLCFYTTPFEEHGVLAILNVQYKFPPYPIYSQQMNALIASMLREHNVHRPSVFEVLDTVHQMRGTKSRFTYNPPKEPLSPRMALSPVTSRNVPALSTKSPESLGSASINGIQAREKVLEAIAPMRRGRPSSPTRGRKQTDDAFNLLDSVEGAPWTSRPAKAHKSGLAAISTIKGTAPVVAESSGLDDAWQVPEMKSERRQPTGTHNGFSDTFSARAPSSSPVPVPAPRPVLGRLNSSLKPSGGDAFESLSVFPSPKPQTLTLGEHQKAVSNRPSPSPQLANQKYSMTPSPSFQSPSPASTDKLTSRSNVSPMLASKASDQALAAEQRFPSLEELDAVTFGSVPSSNAISTPATVPAPSPAPPHLPPRPVARQDPAASFYPASVAGALRPPPEVKPSISATSRHDGVRSQHVTGTAMRDARKSQVQSMASIVSTSSLERSKPEHYGARQSRIETGAREKLQSPSRPTLTRKHRSSISIKHPQRTGSEISSPSKPVSGLPINSGMPKDWLTGVSDGEDSVKVDNAAVLRASPEKRASVLVSAGPPDIARAASFREAAPSPSTSPVKRKPVPLERPKAFKQERMDSVTGKERMDDRAGGISENWSPLSPKSSSSDEADEGPEDAVSSVRQIKDPLKVPAQQRPGHKGRQGSVHDLVDLWGGGSPKPSPSGQSKRNSVIIPHSGNVLAMDQTESRSPSPAVSRQSSKFKPTEKSSPLKSATPIARRPSSSSRHTPSNAKKPPSPTKSQNTSSTSLTSKSRPQSMLLLPVQKSVSETTPQTTPSKLSSLSPPVQKGRPTTHRRSSISDLVSRYEAIDVQSKTTSKPNVPLTAAKPDRLRAASPPPAASSDPQVSPTVASMRFPRISPSSSPKEPLKSSFPSRLEPPIQASIAKEDSRRRDTSPRPGSRAPSPLRQNAALLTKEPSFAETTAIASSRVEKKLFNAPANEPTELMPSSTRKEDGRRSPSPERPYQGVSKLINQWQKKSEEAGGPGGGGSNSLRGPGSRFRRDGIAAGGKLA